MNFISSLLPEEFQPPADCRDCEFTSPIITEVSNGKVLFPIQTGLSAGEFVMLVMPNLEGESKYTTAIEPVQEGGLAEFHLRKKPQHFVTHASAIQPTSENMGNALLVRVTNTLLNDLASGITLPMQ